MKLLEGCCGVYSKMIGFEFLNEDYAESSFKNVGQITSHRASAQSPHEPINASQSPHEPINSSESFLARHCATTCFTLTSPPPTRPLLAPLHPLGSLLLLAQAR